MRRRLKSFHLHQQSNHTMSHPQSPAVLPLRSYAIKRADWASSHPDASDVLLHSSGPKNPDSGFVASHTKRAQPFVKQPRLSCQPVSPEKPILVPSISIFRLWGSASTSCTAGMVVIERCPCDCCVSVFQTSIETSNESFRLVVLG